MTVGSSFSKISQKEDGTFALHAESRWCEAHYEIEADAAPQLAAALGTTVGGIPRAWDDLLGGEGCREVCLWLDAHGIGYRTVFAWY